jgi:hypothetical protein
MTTNFTQCFVVINEYRNEKTYSCCDCGVLLLFEMARTVALGPIVHGSCFASYRNTHTERGLHYTHLYRPAFHTL